MQILLMSNIFILVMSLCLPSITQPTFGSSEIVGPREPGEAISLMIQSDISLLAANNNGSDQQAFFKNSSSNTNGTQAKVTPIHSPSTSTLPVVNTTNSEAYDDDRSLIFGIITANCIIFVIGLCGNAIVILVILKFTRIETVTDIYILNLAFADLMFILGLVFLITTMFIDHWIFGNLMCKVSSLLYIYI